MKYLSFILVFILFPLIIYSQYNCKAFFNNNDNNYIISLSGNYVEFYRFIEEEFNAGEEVAVKIFCKANYQISNDTLIIKSNELFVKSNIAVFYFKILEDGILKSLSNLPPVFKKGDMFFCSRYNYNIETLIGKGWKNGKKNGIWFLIDSIHKPYRIIYKDNVIIEKELMPTSKKLQ